ncbi:MAG TPA: MFS transporter, partial [Ilumatobacteraceae bacterium]
LVIPIVGAAMIGTLTSTNVLLQLNARPEMRGRVMALFSVAVIGSTPIGGPIIGWVGDHFGGRASIIVGAVAAMLAAVYGARRLPLEVHDVAAPDLRAAVS